LKPIRFLTEEEVEKLQEKEKRKKKLEEEEEEKKKRKQVQQEKGQSSQEFKKQDGFIFMKPAGAEKAREIRQEQLLQQEIIANKLSQAELAKIKGLKKGISDNFT